MLMGLTVANAQTATLTGTALGESSNVTITLLPRSTDSYSFSTSAVNGVANGTVVFNVSASTTRLEPAALQFTLSAPATSVSSFSVTTGAAATAASKTTTCAVPTNPPPPTGTTQVNCLVAGINTNAVANGVIANVTATLPATPASGTITLSAPVSSNVAGNAITAVISGGLIALTANPTLAVVCVADPATLAPVAGQLEPGEVLSCAVTLSTSLTTATVVTLTSSATVSPGFTVPASVTIAAGATSASFQITGI